MMLGLRTAIYHVPDLQRAKSWYAEAFGVAPYWGVADIQREVDHFIKLGASVLSPVQDVGDDIRVAVVADPFGNPVGLIENPHFMARP